MGIIKILKNITLVSIKLKCGDTKPCLTKEALEGFGDFKICGQIIHTVKYADDLVLLAKEEKVLHKMLDKLIEIGG
jgi:hypothetical protein